MHTKVYLFYILCVVQVGMLWFLLFSLEGINTAFPYPKCFVWKCKWMLPEACLLFETSKLDLL